MTNSQVPSITPPALSAGMPLQSPPAYCLSCYHLLSRRATFCPDCGTHQQRAC